MIWLYWTAAMACAVGGAFIVVEVLGMFVRRWRGQSDTLDETEWHRGEWG